MDPFGDTLTEQSVVLVRKKFAMVKHLPRPIIESAKIEVLTDLFVDEIALAIRAHVFGERLPSHTETRTTYVPATWWQHLKQDKAARWWMRWLVRRRPVRTEAITLTATWENMAAYPWADLRTRVPNYLGAAVRLSFLSSALSTDEVEE